MTPVDIIIPVYRGLTQTRACIESMLASYNTQPHEIIVINDASPEPAVAEYLASLGEKITLHTNATNLGFVKNCNFAFTLHPDRDVLLLNSDTVVANDWLDRMLRAAESQPNIASVTPFSNNATICSYPRMGEDNALPVGHTVASLDSIFSSENRAETSEIPTAVGFCMLIRRIAIAAIGTFDEAAFGRGYGEENDWCARATAAGFRHLLAADVFVFHEGGVSFAGESDAGKVNAQAVIDARYPSYRDEIGAHFARDAARPLRRRVDMARLIASKKPRVLMLTHGWGGGTERHVMELALMIEHDCEALILRPDRGGQLWLQWANVGEEFAVWFPPDEYAMLIALLKTMGIARVHLHHVNGLPVEILTLADALEAPLDITLHDYFPVTAQYHLNLGAVIPDDDSLTERHAWGLTGAQWRQHFGVLLARAERVICPSHDLRDRMAQVFTDAHYLVWPHAELDRPEMPADIHVLCIGGITPEKGLNVIEACARAAKDRRLPLTFTILGHTSRPILQWPDLPVMVTGSYEEHDLARRVALQKPDVFFFPSQIPESHSYTLSSALAAGRPIVASRLGSFVERLHANAQAWLVAWDAGIDAWLDALIKAGGTEPRGGQKAVEPSAVTAYRTRYLATLAPVRASQPKVGLSPDKYFRQTTITGERELTLTQLLIGGLDCAHQPSRVELRRRVTAADAEMSRLTATVVELTQHRDQFHRERDALLLENEKRAQEIHALTQARLEAESPLKRENEVMRLERDQARDAFGAVVTSTSWRLTAPLRAVAQVVKDAPARAATHARRAAQAGRILRSQGPMALAARIFAKFSHQGASAAPRNETRMPDVAAEISPLNINSSDAPRISIVIPVYGQHLMTFHCLQSIAQTCAAHAIEIILVDDCSPESANVALASVTGVTLLRNETNLGFLGSCNAGAARARGEYLVLLNNDTLTKSGWLDALRDVFTLREDAGLVGAKLIYPDGALQEAGGIVWRDGSAWNVGRGDDASKPEYNYLRDVDYCSGACLMISRNLWVALGGFDLRYAPAYYEDTDLAFRVREAGKRVYYQPEAVIVHFEGRSAGTDLGGGMKRHQVVNQKIFFERWQNTLLSHRENGVAPQFERERRANKRILVIDACMLTPDQDSGSLRMFEILAAARDLGCKVTFVADNLEYSATYTPAIQRQGVEVRYHPYERGVDTYLAHHAAEFDVIVLSRVSVAAKHLAQLRRAAPRAKIIFDTVDLHFVREERASELVGGTGARIAAALTRKQELDVIGRADASLVVSPVEKALLATLLPQAPVHILSNIHVNMPGGKPFAERAGILFIGGFRHPPNLDAITWYVDAVLPILRARAPQLITTIIGSNAPSVLQKFAAPDFVIAGYVPDVEPYFRATRVAISPLRYGAGVKGKVNLAMQYGVPVVATSASAEGMYLAHETNVLIADTAASFADAILRVHEDEALWNKLVAGGHMNIEEHFSRTCARNALRGLLGIDASHR